MKIRPASRSDLNKIAGFMRNELAKAPFNEKASANAVMKSLEFYFKIGKVFIASEQNITGVLVFKTEQYWEGKVIIIEDLIAASSAQKALLDFVESYARKHKLKAILFYTSRKNASAKYLKSRGYTVRNDIISMEKAL